jgi:hypothetical protein
MSENDDLTAAAGEYVDRLKAVLAQWEEQRADALASGVVAVVPFIRQMRWLVVLSERALVHPSQKNLVKLVIARESTKDLLAQVKTDLAAAQAMLNAAKRDEGN